MIYLHLFGALSLCELCIEAAEEGESEADKDVVCAHCDDIAVVNVREKHLSTGAGLQMNEVEAFNPFLLFLS